MPLVYGLELGLECHLLVLESLGKGFLGMTVLVFVSLTLILGELSVQ